MFRRGSAGLARRSRRRGQCAHGRVSAAEPAAGYPGRRPTTGPAASRVSVVEAGHSGDRGGRASCDRRRGGGLEGWRVIRRGCVRRGGWAARGVGHAIRRGARAFPRRRVRRGLGAAWQVTERDVGVVRCDADLRRAGALDRLARVRPQRGWRNVDVDRSRIRPHSDAGRNLRCPWSAPRPRANDAHRLAREVLIRQDATINL